MENFGKEESREEENQRILGYVWRTQKIRVAFVLGCSQRKHQVSRF